MKRVWHFFPRDQIKPALRGQGVFSLAVPAGETARVESFIGGASSHRRRTDLPGHVKTEHGLSQPYGIVFDGVDVAAVKDLQKPALRCDASRFEVACHNKQVITAARNFLLGQTELPAQLDLCTFCLLRGLTHLLPSFDLPRPRPALYATNQSGILLVNDESWMVEMLGLFLSEMGFKKIFTAQDGIAALELLKAQGVEIDVVVLNLCMPRLDGSGVMKALGENYPRRLGIVMESACGGWSFEAEFFRRGTNSIVPIDYMVTPFGLGEFRLEVRLAMEYMSKTRPC